MPLILLASWSPTLRALHFDPLDKRLTPAGSLPTTRSFNWLSSHPSDPSLICATSASNEDGEVRLFRVRAVEGGRRVEWEDVGRRETGGGTAHHLVLEGGEEVVVANYRGGTLSIVPITGGALAPPTQPLIKFPFTAPGPNPTRQEASHPHQIVQLSANDLLVPDLGADKIWRLRRTPSSPWSIHTSIPTPPGSGPRHLLLSPTLTSLYVLNELANSLSHYTLPPPSSSEPPVLRSTQPSTYSPAPTSVASELLLHPAGTHLYATNRDAGNLAEGDSIAIFSLPLSSEEQEPRFVKEVRTGLQHLRGAALHEVEGRLYLITAGMNGGGVKVYEVTEEGEGLVEVARAEGERVTGFVWL